MRDVHYVEKAEHAEALMKPLRLELIKCLADPKSCPELAQTFNESTQKIYYHIKILERAGLIEKVEERKVRGILEGLYQAKAMTYWLSPHLVGPAENKHSERDKLSLGFLLNLAEELQEDIGVLSTSSLREIPSLGLLAEIELGDAKLKSEFLSEIQELFKSLATKYGKSNKTSKSNQDTETYKLKLACYPKAKKSDELN